MEHESNCKNTPLFQNKRQVVLSPSYLDLNEDQQAGSSHAHIVNLQSKELTDNCSDTSMSNNTF